MRMHRLTHAGPEQRCCGQARQAQQLAIRFRRPLGSRTCRMTIDVAKTGDTAQWVASSSDRYSLTATLRSTRAVFTRKIC